MVHLLENQWDRRSSVVLLSCHNGCLCEFRGAARSAQCFRRSCADGICGNSSPCCCDLRATARRTRLLNFCRHDIRLSQCNSRRTTTETRRLETTHLVHAACAAWMCILRNRLWRLCGLCSDYTFSLLLRLLEKHFEPITCFSASSSHRSWPYSTVGAHLTCGTGRRCSS